MGALGSRRDSLVVPGLEVLLLRYSEFASARPRNWLLDAPPGALGLALGAGELTAFVCGLAALRAHHIKDAKPQPSSRPPALEQSPAAAGSARERTSKPVGIPEARVLLFERHDPTRHDGRIMARVVRSLLRTGRRWR